LVVGLDDTSDPERDRRVDDGDEGTSDGVDASDRARRRRPAESATRPVGRPREPRDHLRARERQPAPLSDSDVAPRPRRNRLAELVHLVPGTRARLSRRALDLRGHGRGIRDRQGFTLEDAADDVVALADALEVRSFIAVGYSMGGPVAQLTWGRHRERVRCLVLCATASSFRSSALERLMFAALPALEYASRIVPDALASLIISLVAAPYLSACGNEVWARNELLTRDQRAVLQAASALGRFSADGWIESIDVPSAVLVHSRDQLVPPSRQLTLAARIPHALTRVVDADHFAPVRTPELFTRALVAAVDDVARRDQARGPLSMAG
jgi:pimeloyl-ACP methyl ester carboxylesterase